MSWKVVKPSNLVKSLNELIDSQTNDILKAFVEERELYVKRLVKPIFTIKDFDINQKLKK